MLKTIIALISLFLFSCNKNIQNAILNETNMEQHNILRSEEIDVEKSEIVIFTEIPPKIMYVISKEGLRKRSDPSLNGNITGILLYGERIIIDRITKKNDTVDNIIDYWYGIRYEKDTWVFGGYLSELLPSDVPVFFGRWDNINRERETWEFKPNGDFMNALKESSIGVCGVDGK